MNIVQQLLENRMAELRAMSSDELREAIDRVVRDIDGLSPDAAGNARMSLRAYRRELLSR